MAIPAFIARHLGEQAYRRRIGKGLTEAHGRAGRRDIELSDLRAVVFSDHHRGVGDGADDFRALRARVLRRAGLVPRAGLRAVAAGRRRGAVGEQPAQGHEALRERARAGAPVRRPPAALLRQPRHGVAQQSLRRRSSWPATFRAPRSEEAVRVVITGSGEPLGTLFLVHGHQGTTRQRQPPGGAVLAPGRALRLGDAAAAHVLRQHLAGQRRPSCAASTTVRWRRGPTPMPSASSWWPATRTGPSSPTAGRRTWRPRPGPAERPTSRRRPAATTSRRRAAPARWRWRASCATTTTEPVALERPSYFNTGCCSFGDGDVTALEFSDEQVRLVRWLDDGGGVAAHPLEPARDLTEIFGRVTGQAPDRASR